MNEVPTTDRIRAGFILSQKDVHSDRAARIAAESAFDHWLAEHNRQVMAEAWSEGVTTALSHAILNDDGITLRLEHQDGRPWPNPYRHPSVRAM